MAVEEDKTLIKEVTPTEAGPEEASLIQIYGPNLGRRYVIDQSEIKIGRDADNDIVIDSDTVSRSHARLFVLNKRVLLKDQKSTNGCLVNDEEVDQRELQNGDQIKIGQVIFKFIAGGDTEALYHEEIHRLTIEDGLTGVPNRRFLEDFLERELARAIRYQRPLAVALLDADHFKSVNDTYGHLAGDHVLQVLCRIAKGTIRREELFARYGGEEFVLVMTEKNPEQATLHAEKLRSLIEGTAFEFDGQQIPITVSIGVANLSNEIKSVASFLKEADRALYRAKEAGRNRVCVT